MVVLGVGESCLAFRDFSSLRTHLRRAPVKFKRAVTASILFCCCAICQPKSDLAIYPRLSRRPELTLCKDAQERST